MPQEKDYPKLFIGGDLSGIQRFLYNITSFRAHQSLKGRSAYLQDYMHDVCRTLEQAVKAVGSTTCDIIYDAGGKCYLITDNTAAIREHIGRTSLDLKHKLWEEQQGFLSLNIGYVPFGENPDGSINCNGQEKQTIGTLWTRIHESFALQKNQKFADEIRNHYADFFEVKPAGGKPGICAVTGIESPDCEKVEDVSMLPSVAKQLIRGRELSQADGTKSFEEYADGGVLGILRMDVDGLGKRFSKGFSTFATYKAFSNELSEFFSKSVQDIRKEAQFLDYLTIVYAGGDDLFAVGRWDKTIDFAERIHQEVEQRFAQENIHVSGGMVAVKPKFPIAKAAELAGEAEEAAKRFRKGEKNAFTLLGETVSWTEEFEYVKAYKNEFLQCLQDDMSRRLLHKLMTYAAIVKKNQQTIANGKEADYRYIWHLAYYLTRHIERHAPKEAAAALCKKLRDQELCGGNERKFILISLAARWAELSLRNKH